MKLFSLLLVALERIRTQKRTAGTSSEIESAVDAPDLSEEIFNQTASSLQTFVTVRFSFAGEDETYIKVRVHGSILRIAKSRTQYVLDGDEVVVVTMSSRYAPSRQELVAKQ